MDKSGTAAVAGGKPFFTKTLEGRSVERKCFLNWNIQIFTQ